MFGLFKKKESKKRYYCEKYKVTGINPSSNRKKSIIVIAASTDEEQIIIERSGLLPPCTVENVTPKPTQSQLDLIKRKGIFVPFDSSKEDASIFITRYFDGITDYIPPASRDIVNFAINNNIFIPKYAGTKEAKDYLINALPDKKQEIKELK